jgi:type I restriction enzyme R subunit
MQEFQFFDPKQDVAIVYKRQPHWAQAGTIAFITWRTADSLPNEVLKRLAAEREQLLTSFGLDPNKHWKAAVAKLPPEVRNRLRRVMFEAWDQQLDNGAGACLLAKPEFSQVVADSLRHFDQDRYLLSDFVVMPNHIHLLAAFPTEEAMLAQCRSWKRFTGREINERARRRGEFWQLEQFDHLVRSPEHFEQYRQYIADNPRKAGLAARQFHWHSASS